VSWSRLVFVNGVARAGDANIAIFADGSFVFTGLAKSNPGTRPYKHGQEVPQADWMSSKDAQSKGFLAVYYGPSRPQDW
jgi:hypothetical protein